MTILDEEFRAARDALALANNLGAMQPIERAYLANATVPQRVVLRRCLHRTNTEMLAQVRQGVELFRPEVVVICGIGAGLDGREGGAPGDVIVAQYLHYYEFQKRVPGGVRMRYLPYDQPAQGLDQEFVEPMFYANQWPNRLVADRPEAGVPKLVRGSLVVVEKILSAPSSAEQRRLLKMYDDAVGADMESFGAARAIHGLRDTVDYNPRLLVVRGISDVIRSGHRGQDNVAERQTWKPYAASAAAAVVAEFAEKYLEASVQ